MQVANGPHSISFPKTSKDQNGSHIVLIDKKMHTLTLSLYNYYFSFFPFLNFVKTERISFGFGVRSFRSNNMRRRRQCYFCAVCVCARCRLCQCLEMALGQNQTTHSLFIQFSTSEFLIFSLKFTCPCCRSMHTDCIIVGIVLLSCVLIIIVMFYLFSSFGLVLVASSSFELRVHSTVCLLFTK